MGTIEGKILFLCCSLLFLNGQVFSQIQDESISRYWDGELINGVCWAKSNVDKPGTFASTPEAYGMYYQWNRKKGLSAADSDWDDNLPSEFCWESVNDPCPMGWRVPTTDELEVLLDDSKVAYVCVSQNGISGGRFTDKITNNVIFLPFAGNLLRRNGELSSGETGYYSSSEQAIVAGFANYLEFSSWGGLITFLNRFGSVGMSVRCVADEKCDSIVSHDTVTICSTDLPYEWRDTTFGEGTKTGTYRISRRSCAYTDIAYLHLTVQQENEKSCPGVLINGVCWAKYNVDEPGRFASPGKPYGMLYQWNRKKGWPAITPDSVSGWNSSLDPGGTWEPANDPCPAGWRMPSVEEIRLLTDKAKVTYTEQVGQDGALGSRYTDIVTGNMLFLPITGYRDAQGIRHNVLWIHYWSSTDYWSLDRNSIVQAPYAYGYSVRCVADENACDIVLTASETICKEALPYTWHDTTFRKGTVTGEYCIRRTNPVSRCDTIFYLYLTVDTLCGKPCKERGVFINGVCWAESNVDNPNTFADTPEAFGLLYQWNRKKGYSLKEDIDPDDWKLYDSYVRWEAANNPCPADWRIPTIGEIYTLLDDLKVTREWGQQNGVYGMRFTDKLNGNTVFLPPAGRRSGATASYQDDNSGWYWSSTVYAEKSVWALLFMDETFVYTSYFSPGAYSVRCVAGRDTTEDCGVVTDTSVSVCANDLPYEWCDTTFDVGTKSGTYRFQYISAVTGCDSIVNLHLTVHASDTSFFDAVCYGDDYNDYGFSLPVVYRDTILHDTLQSVWGCDSVRTLHLTVNPEYHTSLYDTVCRGASYNRYGFSLSDVQTDGDYTLSLSSQAGCDSILTLHLKVHPVYDTTLYDTICQGNSYSNYGFSLPSGTSGGTFTKTYSTVHGCDSVVTLHLHVHPVYLFSATQNICQGDTFDFRGRKLYKSGVYYDSLATVHGCDSIYRLTLSVHSTSPLLFPDKVCYGSGYNKYGFSLPSVYHDTLVRDTFRSVWGCDSIRILSLSVQPVYDTPLYDTVCQGDGYYRHGFTLPSVQVDGVHTLTLSSRSGCDSTLILHLKVHPVYNTVLYDSICPSDYYERYGFRLSNLHESSTYRRTESTVHGCDSTVTLHLHVWPTYFYPETVHLCEGDTFDFRGMRYHESGEYYDSLTTTKGCDSIYCLYLSVHPVYDIQLCGVLCEGIPYTQGGFHVSTPGLHYQYLQSAFGCDSTVTLTLTEEKKIEGSIRVLLEDCSTHGYSFFFEPGDMINHWEWDLGDGTLLRSEECYHQYSDSGTYRIQLHAETYNECENRFSYVQRVPPYLREVVIHSDRQVIDEDYPTVHFRTEVFPGMRCLWDFGDGERGEGDRVSHTYNARTEKYYEVRLQVVNSDSCVTESRMDIEVVFLPKALNTFSPNGDGINDVFMPDYEIEIMDRNGLRIYSGASGWDGTYNGRQAKEDTYFYRLHYRTANGKRQKTGYVTLIR